MDKSEPALAPEWLKNSGTSSNTSNQLFAASSLCSVDQPLTNDTRIKSSVSSNHSPRHAPSADRTTSSYFRRSSSTNGTGYSRSYNSFTRGNRGGSDVNGYYNKDKLTLGDYKDFDFSDPLASILPNRFEKDTLRRTQSMLNGKQGEPWPRRVVDVLDNASRSNHNSSNGVPVVVSASGNVDKITFERDFPTLGTEERQGGLEIGRVTSPGLSSVIQSLPVGSSNMIGGEGWTSALAEVPLGVGNNGMIVTPAQQAFPSNPASAPAIMTGGLNMAETVAQSPSRARTPPLVMAGNQKLEEVAIKQSRQLVPVVPSSPRTLVVSPSQKSKPKIGHQQSLLNSVSYTRGGHVRADTVKTSSSESRLQVLKPSRELNGVSSNSKDCSSPTNGSKMVNSPFVITPVGVGSTLLRNSSNNSSFSNVVRNQSLAPLRIVTEKKPSSQSQSRIDFFNTIKNSSANSPSSLSGSGSNESSFVSEKSDDFGSNESSFVSEKSDDFVSEPDYPADLTSTNNRDGVKQNNYVDNTSLGCSNGEGKHLDPMIVFPDEEEAAFLRSLGWEENAGDDEEGLTEEEIKAFVVQYKKLRPFSNKFFQEKQSIETLNSQNDSCDDASSRSGSCSSDIKPEL